MKKIILYLILPILFYALLSTAWASRIDGIWKDVPKDQPEDRFVAYLQTYDTGSAVAVLLDNGGSPPRLYAFLVSNYPAGFQAEEIGGADASLKLENLNSPPAAAEIRIGAQTENVFLHKWFRAAGGGEGIAPDDGIFKDETVPGETSFNVFFQTYPMEGSAVAVVTPDGGLTYHAFLQPSYVGAFDVDDILGQGAHWIAVVDPEAFSPFSLILPEGGASAGFLHKWFQAPVTANTFHLAGTLLYNDAPLPNETDVIPVFTVRDYDISVTADQVIATYDVLTGAYTFLHVPRFATMRVSILATDVFDTLPGNYFGVRGNDMETLTPVERQNYDFHIRQSIHLTEPYDNTQLKMSLGFTDVPELMAPVLFEWEPIPDADNYSITIWRFRSPQHLEGYGVIEAVVSELNIVLTAYDAFLDASPSDEHYEFEVRAFNGPIFIGQSFITQVNGSAGRFMFTVASP